MVAVEDRPRGQMKPRLNLNQLNVAIAPSDVARSELRLNEL